MRKILLILVLIPALVLLAIGGWLLFDNATGKRQWLAWKAERIAQGDRFEWQQLAPPEIPDAEFFAMAPLIAGAVKGKDLDPRFTALEPPKLDKEWGDWKEGRRIDLEACAAAYKTKDLLKALAPFEATLKELDDASRRPHSRIPVDYAEYETPSLLGFRSAVRTLRLRALANLAKGNSDAALADVMTCLRIANHLKAEPSLLVMLLRTAILGSALQPIWEGLLDHRWNKSQLAILQEELLRSDHLASARLAFEGERLMPITGLICTAEGLPLPKTFVEPSNRQRPIRVGWLHKNWIYRNVLETDQFNTAYFLDAIAPSLHRVIPEKTIASESRLNQRRFRKDLALAHIAVSSLIGQIPRIARLQSGIDQAALACALERYRLSKSTYPDTLGELSPTFMANIPHDIVNGKPLRYQRQGNGFRLYSVGWDLKDDGGERSWNRDPKPALDPAKGDWVWLTAAQ
jgi:hypothetical protein